MYFNGTKRLGAIVEEIALRAASLFSVAPLKGLAALDHQNLSLSTSEVKIRGRNCPQLTARFVEWGPEASSHQFGTQLQSAVRSTYKWRTGEGNDAVQLPWQMQSRLRTGSPRLQCNGGFAMPAIAIRDDRGRGYVLFSAIVPCPNTCERPTSVMACVRSRV
ncbi:MAG: hypothetical protein GW854_00005 [Erythrobacter sp.]|nr:hypothetical protein [Erythrobacter sp.]NCQ22718.1 hypothetical protein [Sphingomonadales bacterium]